MDKSNQCNLETNEKEYELNEDSKMSGDSQHEHILKPAYGFENKKF